MMTNMPKATLRADGRWMLPLPRKRGEPRRYVYGKSESICQDKYRIAMGIGEVRVRPGSIAEFVVIHFIPWLSKRVQSESLNRYDVSWRHHICPAFGHRLFSELDPVTVQAGLLREGLEPSSIDLGRGLFMQIVKLAIALGKATPDVLTMIQIAYRPKVTKRKRVDITDKAETLLTRAKGDWMEGPIWMAVRVGLRKGEICGLKISDIKDDHIVIRSQRNHVSGDRNRLKHRQEGEERIIGLPAPMIAKLRSFCQPGTMYVFTRPNGKPISYQHFVREMDRCWLGRPVKSKEKRPEGAPTAHDCRSASIVSLIEAGVNDHTIKDIHGQSADEIIRIYRDESMKRTREAMEKTHVHDNQA